MTTTETTAVTLEWNCGRCRKPYRPLGPFTVIDAEEG